MKRFIDISNKKDSSFIQLDIKEFYQSINKGILTNVIQSAKLHTALVDRDLRLTMHCRKSLLFFGNETWKKKSAESCFYVTMGSFGSAEICELIGRYIQSNLENILSKTNFGLYQDDGLILLRNFMARKWTTLQRTYKMVLIIHARNLTISCFTSSHRQTIHCKLSHSYQIPSLIDCQKILLTKKFLIH